MKAQTLLYDILFPGQSATGKSLFDYVLDNGNDDDDDCSTMSTALLPKEAASSSSNGHNKKRVSFADANEYHDNHLYCREDAAALWHSAQEYQEIKSATSKQARLIHQTEGMMMRNNNAPSDSYTSVLNACYLNCTNDLLESMDDQDNASAATILTPHNLCQLFQVLQDNQYEDRFGLERRAIKPIVQDKVWRRQELVRVIYNVQFGEQWNNGPDEMAQALAEQCRQVSRPCRLFAICLAQA